MSILGVVVRTRSAETEAVAARLRAQPGVDLAPHPGDGRLVAVIEDAAAADGSLASAAATLGAIATWPDVLAMSLVYEYSGPDSPAPDGETAIDYRRWRDGLAPKAPGGTPARAASTTTLTSNGEP